MLFVVFSRDFAFQTNGFPESGGCCFSEFCSGVAAFSWPFDCFSSEMFLMLSAVCPL